MGIVTTNLRHRCAFEKHNISKIAVHSRINKTYFCSLFIHMMNLMTLCAFSCCLLSSERSHTHTIYISGLSFQCAPETSSHLYFAFCLLFFCFFFLFHQFHSVNSRMSFEILKEQLKMAISMPTRSCVQLNV